jgi:hypothetical protein
MEIDGKTLRGDDSPPGPRLDSTTLFAGEVDLKAGVRSLTFRPRPGEDVRADYVVLTTDETIAGYSFPVIPLAK